MLNLRHLYSFTIQQLNIEILEKFCLEVVFSLLSFVYIPFLFS